MKNLYKFSLIIISICLVTSCTSVKKPVKKYDKPFLKEYGDDVDKLKRKHKKTMRNTRARLSEDRMTTNIENQKSKRVYLYEKPENYIVVDGKIISNEDGKAEREVLFYSDSDVKYAENNSGKFDTMEHVLFSDIKVPEGKDAKYYNAKYGYKNYKSVNNMDLQESVDYITVINDTRTQKRKAIVKKQKMIEQKKAEQQKQEVEEIKEKKGFFGFFK
jgi:hypothetical protein